MAMELTPNEETILDRIQVALKAQAAFCVTDNEGNPWPWLQSYIDDGTIESQHAWEGYQPCCALQQPYTHVQAQKGGTPESYAEQKLWEAWCAGPQNTFKLIPQYRVSSYRLDFAHEETMTAIEVDGQLPHSKPDDIAYDCKRQREIDRMGWHVIRFGGKEIKTDVQGCVQEIWDYLAQRTQ